MYDEQKPREPEIAPELIALERQLRGMTPAAPKIDRDRMMFAAGQAAASTEPSHEVRIAGPSLPANRFWPAATFTMTAATLLLATMLVWQRQAYQLASKGDASPPSTNQASEQPREAIAPSPVQFATSTLGLRAFQHPTSGYLGIRYVALTRGVGALEPSSQASTDDVNSSNDTPQTQRNMLEELLPSPRHQMNPRS
jgi:hypothetical protein